MLRGQGRLLIGVALVLALIPVAHAQQTDATSRQNVAGSTGAAELRNVEARRQQLFQAILADPSNLDLAFEYAALSERAGDLEAAISTLERMLVFAPGLPRLQFELGVLYYRLNAWSTARSYFETVLLQPEVPDDIRTRIGVYMGTIEAREQGSTTYGQVGFGVRYQTNANAGPSSPFIELGGWTFELEDDALGKQDWNAYATGRFHASLDLESQGDRFIYDFAGYGALYEDQTDLDTGVVEMKLGPDFNLASIGIDNARLALRGEFGAALLSGDPYIASAGLGGDLTFLLDARTRFTLGADVRQEWYFDSDDRPSSSERSGQTYGADARLEYLLTPDVALFSALEVNRKVASVDYMSSWAGKATAGVVWSFAGPWGGREAPWSVSLSGSVEREIADEPDDVMSLDVEDKTVAYVTAGLVMPLGEKFSLNWSVTYSVSDSNYKLSNWENLAGSVGVSRSF